MRINTPKYNQWKKYQNEKALIKRTRKKIKKRKSRKKKKVIYQSIVAPEILSFTENSESTIEYFNKAITILKSKQNYNKISTLLFDCKNVKYLSIDALMYLLAIIKNFKNIFSGIREIKGNLPYDKSTREKFINSGFLNFVNSDIKSIKREKKKELKISAGNNVSTEDAAKLIDFVIDYYGCSHIKTKFLYKMVIELMTNTHNHAYNNKNEFIKAWYLFASVNDEKKCIEITFVDTGEGIPMTVAKKGIEKFLKKKDNEYIISALNGEYRTETKEKNRGKGLPDIYEHFRNKEINNLKLISCKGKVELNDITNKLEKAGIELSSNLHGTVYYWELKIDMEER